MFDPLIGALTYLLTEGFKYLTKFLNEHGFPLVFDGWGTLALAIVIATVAVLNAWGAKLPSDVAAWIPVLIKIVLAVLEAIGIKATIKAIQATR
ncbi:MAG: hypothetical protein N2559_17365 [Anaerolineae bacterium]|nr:hypothetical protein [Anaerolineae bacterium]